MLWCHNNAMFLILNAHEHWFHEDSRIFYQIYFLNLQHVSFIIYIIVVIIIIPLILSILKTFSVFILIIFTMKNIKNIICRWQLYQLFEHRWSHQDLQFANTPSSFGCWMWNFFGRLQVNVFRLVFLAKLMNKRIQQFLWWEFTWLFTCKEFTTIISPTFASRFFSIFQDDPDVHCWQRRWGHFPDVTNRNTKDCVY